MIIWQPRLQPKKVQKAKKNRQIDKKEQTSNIMCQQIGLDGCVVPFEQEYVKGWQVVIGRSVKCYVICSWHQFCHPV